MSITPTAIIRSASPRPYAGADQAPLSVSMPSSDALRNSAFGANWVCGDLRSTEHNGTTVAMFGSKRLDPGSFVGVLT